MSDHEPIWQLLQDEALLDEESFERLQVQSKKTGKSPLHLLIAHSAITSTPTEDDVPKQRPGLASDDEETLDAATPEGYGKPYLGGGEALPLAGWDRFQIKRFLNRGGMGEVYLAHDPRLNRQVAIKLLGDHNPAGLARFVREAKHQASVPHPHICQIFEAGTEQGRAYIAMQYIDGCDLLSACKDMDLEEKLQLFLQISKGLHEAHRQGLVHRDIKPGNIMVEDCALGRPHAYVLDFGLARNLRETFMTRTGDMMGTPAYMAPEQALGELHLIDRHTDIYSLGGTMYKVISGSLPITGNSDLEMLNQTIQGEVRPLHQVDPGVPRDVDTIVMKCLQPKAKDRYGSALALADDLDRYLKGEPILARPVSSWERVRKFVHRNKTLVRLAAVGLCLLLLSLGWGLKMRHDGGVRAQLTQAFTTRVEQIEALARYMHMAPLHDLSPDRNLIRAHMDGIEEEMERVGASARGPGHFALGKGFMTLNQPQKALEHLQQAWDGGFQEARVADALSRVLGAMYRDALVEVERIKREEPRERRLRAVKAQYGEPALHYALLVKESTEVSGEVEALTAFYAGDYERAQRLLNQMERGHSWFYERDKLSGDIFLVQANILAKNHPEDAAEVFTRARETYAQALEVGPSDPTLYLAQAQTDYAQMLMNAHGGNALEPFFQRGLEALDQALIVHPDWDRALLQKADFLRQKGIDARRQFTEKARGWLEEAIAACVVITSRDPSHDRANHGLARALSQLAQIQKQMGEDPLPTLERALARFQRVGEEYRDADYYNELGLVLKTRADDAQRRGEPSGDDRLREIDAYDQAVAFDSTAAAPLINKASALLALARVSQDPMPILERGIVSLEHALELSAQNIAIHYYMGILLTNLAYEKNMRSQHFENDLLRAQAVYGEGIELAPKRSFLYNGLSGCFLDQARMAREHGKDPLPYLQSAVKHSREALAVAPNDHFALHNLGSAFTRQADFLLDQGADPGEQLAQAQASLEKALQSVPNNPFILVALSEVWCLKAVLTEARGNDPDSGLARARELLTRVLTQNPKYDKAHLLLSRLHLLRMQRAFALGGDWQEILAEALATLDQVGHARFDRDLLIMGYVRYHQALQLQYIGRDPQEALREGLAVVDGILARRPLGEALALRAVMRGLRARIQTPPDEAEASAADQALEQALTLNPHLSVRWATQNQAAQVQAKRPPSFNLRP